MRKVLTLLAFSFVLYSCKTETENGIIDLPYSYPPHVKSVIISPDSVSIDTLITSADSIKVNLNITAKVIDKDGQSDIENVYFSVVRVENLFKKLSGNLTRKNDSIFASDVTLTISKLETGRYRAEVYAVDKSNFKSNTVVSNLEIIRTNHPPEISDLNAPDTVYLGFETILVKMSVKATDPDGQGDIKMVYFNSFRPDGTPSSGNPFQLYDDGGASGISGDDVAGDGIYSIIIQIPPGTQKGKYRFEFQAVDRSNAKSNIIVHNFYVL